MLYIDCSTAETLIVNQCSSLNPLQNPSSGSARSARSRRPTAFFQCAGRASAMSLTAAMPANGLGFPPPGLWRHRSAAAVPGLMNPAARLDLVARRPARRRADAWNARRGVRGLRPFRRLPNPRNLERHFQVAHEHPPTVRRKRKKRKKGRLVSLFRIFRPPYFPRPPLGRCKACA
jgi:hypothetical protein